jgi:hypothetical protein
MSKIGCFDLFFWMGRFGDYTFDFIAIRILKQSLPSGMP